MQSEANEGDLVSGRYRLVSRLGAGGMGTVWRAEDELLERRVALKEVGIPPGLPDVEIERLRMRYLREARAAARLRHQNVVTVYDILSGASTVWIVMELFECPDLAQVVRAHGPLTPVATAKIGLQVLAALCEAHEAGVVHRDVKPGNVLITQAGRAVLTDFGVARVAGDMSLTATGQLVGSPAYLSPERLTGLSVGPPADMWSLGCTLYAAVEGHSPFNREGPFEIITAISVEALDPPKRAGALAPVLYGLLEKEVAERWDAPRAQRALEQVVAGEDVDIAPAWGSPSPSSMPGRPRPEPRSAEPDHPSEGRHAQGYPSSSGSASVPSHPVPPPRLPRDQSGDGQSMGGQSAGGQSIGGPSVGGRSRSGREHVYRHPSASLSPISPVGPAARGETSGGGRSALASPVAARPEARPRTAPAQPAEPPPGPSRGRGLMPLLIVLAVVAGFAAGIYLVVQHKNSAPPRQPESGSAGQVGQPQTSTDGSAFTIAVDPAWTKQCQSSGQCSYSGSAGDPAGGMVIYTDARSAQGRNSLVIAQQYAATLAADPAQYPHYASLGVNKLKGGLYLGSVQEFTYRNARTGNRHVKIFRTVSGGICYEISLNGPSRQFADSLPVWQSAVESLRLPGD
ncbi:MAG: eukaryotic-like serine/threonine-protein kinase [Cryptosporangiaceae bacterium]|nr:eukaryotic-like serine/threonine-protein kinase [Cryptosporangiaceae bacterium]